MPKFRVCIRVEEISDGSFEVEANSLADVRAAFERGDYDGQSEAADLDLSDRATAITEIIELLPPSGRRRRAK
jgi:hypothetical protein